MRLPDPECSYAVLIGSSTYHSAELADLPAVRNNIEGLAEVLTNPTLGGLLSDRCTVLSDPADMRVVYRILRTCASKTSSSFAQSSAGTAETTRSAAASTSRQPGGRTGRSGPM